MSANFFKNYQSVVCEIDVIGLFTAIVKQISENLACYEPTSMKNPLIYFWLLCVEFFKLTGQ